MSIYKLFCIIQTEGKLPNLFYYATVTFLPKSCRDKKIEFIHEFFLLPFFHFFRKIEEKILNRLFVYYLQSQQQIKKVIDSDQVGFIQKMKMQGSLKIWKSITVIYPVNQLKEKNNPNTLSLNAEQIFEKIQHLFL